MKITLRIQMFFMFIALAVWAIFSPESAAKLVVDSVNRISKGKK